MQRTCKQCGKEFILSQSEISFYKSKNLNLPKRCKECREANKKAKDTEKTEEHKQITYHNNEKTNAPNEISPAIKILVVVAILLFVFFVVCFWFGGNTGDSIDSWNSSDTGYTDSVSNELSFRNADLLNEHYQKHGIEMGFTSATAYEAAARKVVQNSNSLHKLEAEDGDDVYYLENTNEFVIVSTDGYIRTYFKPNEGKSYYDRQ